MNRTIPITRPDGAIHWLIFCPGCEMGHSFGPGWTFNGDQVRPTFLPSLMVRMGPKCGPDGLALPGEADRRCHSFVRDGMIHFLSDCTHALAGQSVELGGP